MPRALCTGVVLGEGARGKVGAQGKKILGARRPRRGTRSGTQTRTHAPVLGDALAAAETKGVTVLLCAPSGEGAWSDERMVDAVHSGC